MNIFSFKVNPLTHFIKFVALILLTLHLTVSCSTTKKAGQISSEETGQLGWCNHSTDKYIPPETQIELLSFLSVDSISVDELPQVVGGMDSLLKLIMYPEIAKRAGIEGIVILEFKVDALGNPVDHKIIKSVGAGCDDAVIWAFLYKQKYIPAKTKGSAVVLLMRVAIKFTVIPKDVKKDFLPRPIDFNKDAIKAKTRLSLYPPPTIEQSDSVSSTGN